jgi:hypothetical protein
MPKFQHCSKSIAVFVILLYWPLAAAVGQMVEYGSAGFNEAAMQGSCAACQESYSEPEWYGAGYETYGSVPFADQCGCNECSAEIPGALGDPGMAMPYTEVYPITQACEMPTYSCDSGNMMLNTCGGEAPYGLQSGCGEYNGCGAAGCDYQQCCPCGNAAPFWFGAEALIWRTSSVRLPPLVTSSEPGTQQLDAGVLGRPTTQILYGGNKIFDSTHGGFRLRGGHYFDQCGISGIDLEFFMLGTQQASYHGASNGEPILARPFLNAATGLDDAQLVAFPNLASGTIDIKAKSNLYSGALHFREVFWKECDPGNGCSRNCRRSGPRSFNLGFQMGPRFVRLRETFTSAENLTNSDTQAQYQIYDSFGAKNQFWGCELGLFGSRQRRRWSLDGAVRLAIGATKQELDVSGQTSVTQAGITTTNSGGFLAQRTNSGNFDRNRFTLLPQFDVALGYKMTDTWTASVGYSLLYWGQVLRATDQIDPVVNPGLLPPEQIPLTGDLRPEARLHQTDYLAHGITIGLEKRW